jgi:nucleoside-diphosphate-sugar epimerase
MKVLITGTSGRLGQFVVRELEQAGHDLVLTSRSRPAAADRWPWVQGNITNHEDCLRATEGGIDAIQHVAATPFPTDHPESRESAAKRGLPFDETMRTNVMGTYYLLQAALARNIGIFVMTGSNCALGHGFRIGGSPFPYRYLPVDEDHSTDVHDSYSYSKLAGEELLASYTRAYGMRTYALRSAGICGPDRRANIARSATPAGGWDDWMWAWVGAEDIACAHRLLMEKAPSLPPHAVFFCNANDTTALETSCDLVARFRPDLLPLCRDLQGNASFLSNRKLRELVGWVHRTSWRDLVGKS